MGHAKVSKSEEKVNSVGIITIRTTREMLTNMALSALFTQCHASDTFESLSSCNFFSLV